MHVGGLDCGWVAFLSFVEKRNNVNGRWSQGNIRYFLLLLAASNYATRQRRCGGVDTHYNTFRRTLVSAHALPTHCCTISLCWMPISIWYLVGATAVDHGHIVLSFHEMLTLLTIREHLDFVVTPVVQCCNALFPTSPLPRAAVRLCRLVDFCVQLRRRHGCCGETILILAARRPAVKQGGFVVA